MPKQEVNEDKRRYQRVSFREPVLVSILPETASHGHLSCDLSEGGLRMYFDDFVPLESRVAVSVPVDVDRKVNVLGRVAWIQRVPHAETYQVGVEFSARPDDVIARNEIRKYIQIMKF
ncbi:MAG: PilZ domain-containing protein [Candidatus Omnitrophota bacterium]|nr:PilZ domain-containing protein [Candidatus Omnitrophota bacterium]MDZ4242318.1 PilZ domain-containing protein [Candidatus Omnitrophota bacterium]